MKTKRPAKGIISLSAILIFILNFTACHNKIPCKNIDSDKEFYRASAVAYSNKRDIAEEKAVMIAKKHLIKEIADDMVKKTGINEKLLYDSLKKGITMRQLEVVCKKVQRKKGSFRCSIALEVPASKFSKLHFD